MKKRVLAWLNLAYRFALHVTWRLPARALGYRRDYDRFLHTINTEGYVPLDAAVRERFPDFMQCIHCGLCTLACPELRSAPHDAWQEAWTFVAGPSRSLERAPLVAAALTPCSSCGDCAAACPTGVPIPLMASALKRLAASTGPASASSATVRS